MSRRRAAIINPTGDLYFQVFNGLVTLPVAEKEYDGNRTISTGGTSQDRPLSVAAHGLRLHDLWRVRHFGSQAVKPDNSKRSTSLQTPAIGLRASGSINSASASLLDRRTKPEFPRLGGEINKSNAGRDPN